MRLRDKIIIYLILAIIFTSSYVVVQNYALFREEATEGYCTEDKDCLWSGDMCEIGKGKCTSHQNEYKFTRPMCNLEQSSPYGDIYRCGCIRSVNHCGWKISVETGMRKLFNGFLRHARKYFQNK